jgi:hypothetical protein
MEKTFKVPLRKPTFTQAYELMREASYHLKQFSSYGIMIKDDLLFFDFNTVPYIREEIAKNSWNFGLNLADSLALQLALYQEDINDYVREEEIERIARFFEVGLTRESINRLGSKYI